MRLLAQNQKQMKNNKLSHKGFTGTHEVSLEDGCIIGRIEFIEDIISYEGETVAELDANFKAAVVRYLAYCEETGRPANKPYSGTFNVRVGQELHRLAAQKANAECINLNEFVTQAINAAVHKNSVPNIENIDIRVVTIDQEQHQWTVLTGSQGVKEFHVPAPTRH